MNVKHFKRMKKRGGVLFERLRGKLKKKRLSYMKKSHVVFRAINNLPLSRYR